DPSFELTFVRKGHGHGFGSGDHMVVGEDIAVRGYDDPRALPATAPFLRLHRWSESPRTERRSEEVFRASAMAAPVGHFLGAACRDVDDCRGDGFCHIGQPGCGKDTADRDR